MTLADQMTQTKIKIGIIGINGVVGSFFRRVFEAGGYEVIGSDVGTTLTNVDVVRLSDVVVFCTPVLKSEEIIREMAQHAIQGQLWIDTSSIKDGPLAAMPLARVEVLGLHQLASPLESGTTLEGQTIAVCRYSLSKWGLWSMSFVETLGAKVVVVESKLHDRTMLLVQNFIHLVALVFPLVAARMKVSSKNILSLSTPPAKLFCKIVRRVLSKNNPSLYANIQMGNPQSVKMIDAFIEVLQGLRKIVADKDVPAYVAKMDEAKTYVGKKFLDEALEKGKK